MKHLCRATRWIFLVSAALTLIQPRVSALSILSVTGKDEPSGGWVVIFNGQGYASSWKQGAAYSNVTISATLTSFGMPEQTGRVYLTRRLGPGTTTNDEVASAEFTFPLDVADVPLFTGLTIPPGRYYLSMIGNNCGWGSGWMSGCPAKIDAADGVLLGNDFGFFGVDPYLPASGIAENPSIEMRLKVFTPTNGSPPSPTAFQASLRAYTTAAEILLTWEPLAGADHYEVHRAGEDLRWQLVNSDVRSAQFRDGGYTWFPTYHRIIAVTAAGERYLSETVSAPPLQRLLDLSGLSLRPLTETSVSIDWEVNYPLRNVSGPQGIPARVLVEVGPNPSALSIVKWTTDFAHYGQEILDGLAPDTTYWYRLTFTAPNDCGFSYLNQFTTRPPSPPQHVVVDVQNGFAMLFTEEDTPILFTLAVDERDPAWTFAITAPPMHGTISGTGPELLYTPAPDWDGLDMFSYTATSGMETISGVINVMFNPANDAPVALEPLLAFAEEDVAGPLPLEGRELDSFGSVTGFVIVSGPDHGTFENGLYTPAPNFHGIDHLTYRASDGMAEGNVATVRIRVQSVNDTPSAGPQTVIAYQNTAQPIVLAAADPDEELLSMFINTPPSHGTLGAPGIEFYDVTRCHGVSELLYTPDPGFTGTDTFDYMVNDGTYSAAGSVVIQVITPNHPPTAAAQSVTTEFGVPVTIHLSGTDPDGDSLSYSVVTNPTHGTLGGALPSILYTPAAGYSGSDGFGFVVQDGQTSSAPATVAVVVLSEDAPPMAPFGLVATALSGHRVNLRWNDASIYEKGFRLERSVDGSTFKQIASVNANVTEFVDTGTQANKVYSYRVRAYNKNGNSDYSDAAGVAALP